MLYSHIGKEKLHPEKRSSKRQKVRGETGTKKKTMKYHVQDNTADYWQRNRKFLLTCFWQSYFTFPQRLLGRKDCDVCLHPGKETETIIHH